MKQGIKKDFALLIKPVGADCNLNCAYCFYSRASELYPDSGRHIMPGSVLAEMVRKYMSLDLPVSAFAWQGGEPTLAGIDFFREVVGLQQKYGKAGQVVSNSLQTNGTLINEEWAEFLCSYKFLVGLSIDGPKEIHDRFRVSHAGRGGSWDKACRAARLFDLYPVEYNILSVVNSYNAGHVESIYGFFREKGWRYLQFIPCLEVISGSDEVAPFSVSAGGFGEFLCRLFDCWIKDDPLHVSIRLFDSVMNKILTGKSTQCSFLPECGDYLLVEHDGRVYPCDFFAYEKWCIGDLGSSDFQDLVWSALERDFISRKYPGDDACKTCKYLEFCYGGCLKDRIAGTPEPEGRSYFCESYRMFFDHALDRLRQVVLKHHNGFGDAVEAPPKISRNAPCPCGSGRKYKRCCGRESIGIS